MTDTTEEPLTPEIITTAAFKVSREKLNARYASDRFCKSSRAKIEKAKKHFDLLRRKVTARKVKKLHKLHGQLLARKAKIRRWEKEKLIQKAATEFLKRVRRFGLTPKE